MKIITASLSGAALDWAVAKCEGINPIIGATCSGAMVYILPDGGDEVVPEYSTDWDEGGPIIEREKLCIGYNHQPDPNYCHLLDPKTICWARTTAGGYLKCGRTLLEAAMRCFVASKLGDEVEIPEELI